MFKKLRNKESGFTIIEVMIVLAIAGLILVVVLLAIPQLQRNQRNEARRSAASRIVAEINNYGGNNNSQLPVDQLSGSDVKSFNDPTEDTGFFGRYLGCVGGTCSANINDPQSGFPMGSGDDGATPSVAYGSTGAVEPGTNAGDLYYGVGFICDGEAATATGASARNFAFVVRLEGGAGYCLDNR